MFKIKMNDNYNTYMIIYINFNSYHLQIILPTE